MKQLNQLYHAVQPLLKELEQACPNDAKVAELRRAISEAKMFLETTKAFEYTGTFNMPHSTLKLPDLGMDIDDAVKMMVGQSSGIKFDGELYIIVYPDKPATDEKKAA